VFIPGLQMVTAGNST